MSFLEKIKATLAGFNQRPNPTAARDDDRRDAVKNMNEQKEEEVRETQGMEQTTPVTPDPSQGVEEDKVSL